ALLPHGGQPLGIDRTVGDVVHGPDFAGREALMLAAFGHPPASHRVLCRARSTPRTSRLLRDLAQDRRLARLGPGVRRDAHSPRLPTGVIGVALNRLAFSPDTVRGEARKGSVLLEVAMPSLLTTTHSAKEAPMGRVVIGMDPHKRSATIEVLDEHERVLAGRY